MGITHFSADVPEVAPINVSSKAVLSVNITLMDEANVTKSYLIREGDTVNNLRYKIASGAYRTISGVVRVLNYSMTKASSSTEQSKPEDDTGSCVKPSQFSSLTKVSSLVIDCSTRYEAHVRTVPINAIVAIGSVNVSALGVHDVQIVDYKTLSVMCNVTPDTIMWNNKIVPFELEKAEEGTRAGGAYAKYIVALDSMKSVNDLRIFSSDSFFSTTVDGIVPDTDRTECIENGIIAITSRIKQYVDKPAEGTDHIIEIPDDDMFVIAATNVGDNGVVVINDEHEIPTTKTFTVTVGNNSVITPAFKIVDGMFMVNVLIMPFFAEAGKTTVTIESGGFKFEVPVVVRTESNLEVTAVKGGGKEGYENTLETVTGEVCTTFVHNRQDGTAYVTVTPTDEKKPVDTNEYVFMRSEEVPKPEARNLTPIGPSEPIVVPEPKYTFTVKKLSALTTLYNGDFREAFVDDAELHSGITEYAIFIPTKGMLRFAINTVETIKKDKVDDAEALKTALADDKKTYIVLGADMEVPQGIKDITNRTTIDGDGHKITCKSVASNEAGILIKKNSKGVIVKNVELDVTGDCGIKAYGAENVIFENLKVTSHSKAAIQVNSSEVLMRGTFDLDTEKGAGIEVLKSEEESLNKPVLTIEATEIKASEKTSPVAQINKVAANDLYTAIIDKSGLLKPMDKDDAHSEEDQMWFKV